MYSQIYKYLLLALIQTFVFSHFVACGSDQYKKSLENDIEFNPQDQTSEFYGIHTPAGWNNLPIPIYTESRLTGPQETQLLKAVATWEAAVGKQLFRYMGKQSDEGDDFLSLNESLNDNKNGNYLNYDWDRTGKEEIILATTIWEKSFEGKIIRSDIRFNVEHYLLGDSELEERSEDDDKEIVDMESLALHELGHLLGLDHVDPEYDQLSIMNPTLYIGHGFTSREISDGDIERIRKVYGCNGCDQEAALVSQN